MALHGKDGYLKAGSEIVNLTSYSLDSVIETGETSSMGDTWATFLQGLEDYTATAEGKSQVGLDTTAMLGTGDAAAEFSTATGGADYTGGVIISGITETAIVDDVITVSYTFEGNDSAGLVYAATGGTGAAGTATPIHGKSIAATWGAGATAFVGVRGWTLTMTAPISDSTVASPTAFGRTKLAGINTATATVTVLTPTTDIDLIQPTVAALTLSRSATSTDGVYTGSAIKTGSQTGVDTTGTEITVYSFQFTGVVDLATT